MTARALQVGSVVQTHAPLTAQNHSGVVPAIVTRIWERSEIEGLPVWIVNLWVLHDGPWALWRSPVYVFEDETAASTVPGWNAWIYREPLRL